MLHSLLLVLVIMHNYLSSLISILAINNYIKIINFHENESSIYGSKSPSGNIWIALIDSHTQAGLTRNWAESIASAYRKKFNSN